MFTFTRQRSLTVIAAAAAITIALTGCTINMGSEADGDDMGMMDENSSTADQFGSVDRMFAQMMIPHHEQAVEMSELAKTRSNNPEVLALAQQIHDAQAPEIELMQSWLAGEGAVDMMDHNMGMDGMLDEADMVRLEAATGTQFDKLFLEGMIAHHEGALQMTELILDSNHAEVKALGENIVAGQTAEIATMKAMLDAM
jgi:uncharacterized protein (DUF305 family)